MGYTDQFGNPLAEGVALEDQLASQGGSYSFEQMGLGVQDLDFMKGVAYTGETFGQNWNPGDKEFMDFMFQEANNVANTALAPVQAATGGGLWSDSKEMASGFWKTLNDPGNKTGVTLGALFLQGMLSQPTRERQTRAYEKQAQASMLNAQTNANALALQQQKLENASSIKNTNFGQMQTPKFQDLLAPRRARNGLINTEV